MSYRGVREVEPHNSGENFQLLRINDKLFFIRRLSWNDNFMPARTENVFPTKRIL